MRRWAVAAAAALVVALAGVAEAQVSWTVVVGDVVTISPVSPGGTCTYGGFTASNDPLIGSTVSGTFCFPGNTGPTGATGATGATGPAGQDASGVRWVDASDVLVDDVYSFVSMTGVAGPRYWTGDAFWPISSATGLSALDGVGATLLHYPNNTCTGTPIIGMDGFRQNEVFLAYTSIAQMPLEQWSAYRTGDSVSPANCWYKNSSNVCVTSPSCGGWTLMAEALSAGSPPDLSAYEFPLRETAAP